MTSLENTSRNSDSQGVKSGSKEDKLDFLQRAWDDTPILKKIPQRQYQVFEQEHRSLIIKLMGAGMDIDNNGILRHIFTGKELHTYLEEKLQRKIKISNIYHHLSKLEDIGVIHEIVTFMEGKRKTRYFGRTAKLYIFYDDPENIIQDPELKKIAKLLSHFNPEIPENDFVKAIKGMFSIQNKEYDEIIEWVTLNHRKISEFDIGPNFIIPFFYDLIHVSKNSGNKQLIKVSEVLQRMLGDHSI